MGRKKVRPTAQTVREHNVSTLAAGIAGRFRNWERGPWPLDVDMNTGLQVASRVGIELDLRNCFGWDWRKKQVYYMSWMANIHARVRALKHSPEQIQADAKEIGVLRRKLDELRKRSGR